MRTADEGAISRISNIVIAKIDGMNSSDRLNIHMTMVAAKMARKLEASRPSPSLGRR